MSVWRERDTETGLDYFGARYYDGRIARWLSVDPISGVYPGVSPYEYVVNNPIRLIDHNGMDSSSSANQEPDSRKLAESYEMASNIPGIGILYSLIAGYHWDKAGDKERAATNLQNAATNTVAVAAINAIARSIPSDKSKSTSAINKLEVKAPYGVARQANTLEALAARQAVAEGAQIYRAGQFGVQQGSAGQFWSLNNPLSTRNYSNVSGMPTSASPEWIMAGTVRPGASFVTRGSPGLGSNLGGAMEVVVPADAVRVNWFHTIGK